MLSIEDFIDILQLMQYNNCFGSDSDPDPNHQPAQSDDHEDGHVPDLDPDPMIVVQKCWGLEKDRPITLNMFRTQSTHVMNSNVTSSAATEWIQIQWTQPAAELKQC